MSLGDLASLATAAGVVLVAVQLVFGRLQRRTSFEDDLAREYRELAARLPAAAFFDVEDPRRPLPPLEECLEHYVRYFDLSNQQVFLRMEHQTGPEDLGSLGGWDQRQSRAGRIPHCVECVGDTANGPTTSWRLSTSMEPRPGVLGTTDLASTGKGASQSAQQARTLDPQMRAEGAANVCRATDPRSPRCGP